MMRIFTNDNLSLSSLNIFDLDQEDARMQTSKESSAKMALIFILIGI